MHHFTSKNPSAIFPAKFNIVQKASFSQMEMKKHDALRHQKSLEEQQEHLGIRTLKPQTMESLI